MWSHAVIALIIVLQYRNLWAYLWRFCCKFKLWSTSHTLSIVKRIAYMCKSIVLKLSITNLILHLIWKKYLYKVTIWLSKGDNLFSQNILFICMVKEIVFLSNLQLLLQKARHRDSDPAAVAATAAALDNFLKALYFRRWKTWMLNTLYIDALCYEIFVCHMTIFLEFNFMVQYYLKRRYVFVIMISFSLWVIG